MVSSKKSNARSRVAIGACEVPGNRLLRYRFMTTGFSDLILFPALDGAGCGEG